MKTAEQLVDMLLSESDDLDPKDFLDRTANYVYVVWSYPSAQGLRGLTDTPSEIRGIFRSEENAHNATFYLTGQVEKAEEDDPDVQAWINAGNQILESKALVIVGVVTTHGNVYSQIGGIHRHLGQRGASWRYLSTNRTVYWHGDSSEHSSEDEALVRSHVLDEYGEAVRMHVTLEELDATDYSRDHSRAHGRWAESSKAEIEKEAEQAEAPASKEQAEAGNYKKGHVTVQGLEIAIENAKGSTRSGKDKSGKPWSVTMPAHYGYIKGTVGKDKDHLDVYIGENPSGMVVFVVNQKKLEGGFDEHKIMIGFRNKEEALDAYDRAFSGDLGPKLRETVVSTTVDKLKAWIEKGNTKKPFQNLTESLEGDLGFDDIKGFLMNSGFGDPETGAEFHIGFTIGTSDEHMIESNAEGTPIDWNAVNEAIKKIERNVLKGMSAVGINCQAEGHDSYGDLIGSARVRAGTHGFNVVKQFIEQDEPFNTSIGTLDGVAPNLTQIAYEGVDPEVARLIDVDISFFDLDTMKSEVDEALEPGAGAPGLSRLDVDKILSQIKEIALSSQDLQDFKEKAKVLPHEITFDPLPGMPNVPSASEFGIYVPPPHSFDPRSVESYIRSISRPLYHELIHSEQIGRSDDPAEMVASALRFQFKGNALNHAAYKRQKQEMMAFAGTMVDDWASDGLSPQEMRQRLRRGQWRSVPGHETLKNTDPKLWQRFVVYATEYIDKLEASQVVESLLETDLDPKDFAMTTEPLPRTWGELKPGDVVYEPEIGSYSRIEGYAEKYGGNYQDVDGNVQHDFRPARFVRLSQFNPAYAYGNYAQKLSAHPKQGLLGGAVVVNLQDTSDEALWKLVDEEMIKDGVAPEELQAKRDRHRIWLAAQPARL